MKEINLGVRFLLELATLAALGYRGFTEGDFAFQRFALGLGMPLLAAVLWGLFVSPKAQVQLAEPLHYGIGLLIMGAGALALAATGSQALAGAFALLIVINTLLVPVWRQ